jgi:pyrroline-5-carboxylate reductase
MASAIADGLLEHRKDLEVLVSDPALENSWGSRQAKVVAPDVLFHESTWLVWAIKPQVFKSETQSWSELSFAGKGMVSVMAGIPSSSIEALFPSTPIIRTMPNTPMLVGEGMVALSRGSCASASDLETVEGLFSSIAQTMEIKEEQMHGVTAISGSGPAYLFRLSEVVSHEASELGLSSEQALTLWSQTLRGAATLMDAQGDPGALREQVTSPGGTTQAALESFAKNELPLAFAKGLRAAHERSVELSR